MSSQSYDPKMERFKFQLEILKAELQSIDQTIARIDGITQATKNWAVVTWAGIISLAIGQPDLRKFTLFTAILPFFFWLIDGHWRSLQRRTTFRAIKIREFLNDKRLQKSFEKKEFVDFIVYDTTARQYEALPEYKKFISLWRALTFNEVANFYMGLIIISLAVGLFFL